MENLSVAHTQHTRLEDISVSPAIALLMEAFFMSHPALDPKPHWLANVDSFDDYSIQL